jgi:hypothetical protein
MYLLVQILHVLCIYMMREINSSCSCGYMMSNGLEGEDVGATSPSELCGKYHSMREGT